MKTALLIVAVLLIGVLVFEFIRKNPYHAMSVYYAGMFVKRLLLPSARVRETVAIQLVLMAVCFVMAYIGYHSKTAKGLAPASIPCIKKGMIVVGIVLLFEVINGVFSNYSVFSLFVDIYKVAEIFFFYFIFVYIWRTTEDLEKAVDLLSIEMCLFGIVEMFTTERGGVGLNMVMSLFPIFFALAFYAKKKGFWAIIVCSILIVLISKTRTYMLGFILAFLLIFLFGNGKKKLRIIATTCCIVAIGLAIALISLRYSNNTVLREIAERLKALSGGFEEAGGYRIYEMETAWQKFLESPWLGKGYGYMEYVYIETQGYLWWGDFMHNAYLEVLAKTGLLGLFLYGGGLFGYCKKQYQEMSRAKNDKSKEAGFLLGGLAGTLCWLFIYFAAPLSSYGYVFIPGMIGLLYSQLNKREQLSKENLLSGQGIENGK